MAVRFDADTEDYSRSGGVFGANVCTVCCWVVLDVDRNTFQTAWDVHIAGGSYLLLQTDSDGTTWFLWDSTTGGQSLFAATVGTWYFIAMSKNGSGANATTVYWAAADAVSLSSSTGTHGTTMAPDVLMIGESTFGGEWLNGRVAAFKAWDGVALSQAEIEMERWQYMPERTLSLNCFFPFLVGGNVAAAQQDFSGSGNNLTGGAGSATADGPPIIWCQGNDDIIIPAAAAAVDPFPAGYLKRASNPLLRM